jgi:hypothetical protein
VWNADVPHHVRRIASHLVFDDYIKLTRRFHFLVALDFQVVAPRHFLSIFSFSVTVVCSGDGVPAHTLFCWARILRSLQEVSYPSLYCAAASNYQAEWALRRSEGKRQRSTVALPNPRAPRRCEQAPHPVGQYPRPVPR